MMRLLHGHNPLNSVCGGNGIFARLARYRMKNTTPVAIIPIIPSMKKIAPLMAGRIVGSLAPMHASQAFATAGIAASASARPVIPMR
jgi:hypothetical protein